jgi:hypothetical protein
MHGSRFSVHTTVAHYSAEDDIKSQILELVSSKAKIKNKQQG